jgi:hypothetical protein
VKLIPRIPNDAMIQSTESTYNFRRDTIGEVGVIRIPQRLFNPSLVKNECRKEKSSLLGKSFYVWKD